MRMAFILTVLAACGFPAGTAEAGVIFDLRPEAGMSQQAIDGFEAAAGRWAGSLSDDVTVNLIIGFRTLGPNILGSTNSSRHFASYQDVVAALTADLHSTTDAIAVANLQPPPARDLWLNRTADSPNGPGSATPYLDDDGSTNNQTVSMTTANAKAMGLTSPTDTAVDATIVFSSDFTWDFDPTDGVVANAFDFIGVAAHEIGHALGFISGVDVLDYNSDPQVQLYPEDAFIYIAPLDFFRYSAQNLPEIDWTADQRPKYFSIDGGITPIEEFSTGVSWGDGRQASHWKDNLGLGLMDPTAGRGEVLAISNLDLMAFDVIGWQLVPEPGSLLLLGAGLAGLALLRRRKKKSRCQAQDHQIRISRRPAS